MRQAKILFTFRNGRGKDKVVRGSKPMYFAIIEARPVKRTPGFDRYAGAQVACWVKTLDPTAGLRRAKNLIQQAGWSVVDIIEEKIVSSEIYSEDHEFRKYFEQALIDEEVCVIITYPKTPDHDGEPLRGPPAEQKPD